MTTFQILLLVTMGLVFAVWCFFMFRMLFRLWGRSLDKTAQSGGGFFAWVGDSLDVFTNAATSAEDRPLRRGIIWGAVILMALSVLSALFAGFAKP